MEGISHKLTRSYSERGFAVVPGVYCASEVARMAVASDVLRSDEALMQRDNLRAQTRMTRDRSDVIDRLDPVSNLDKCFSDAVLHPKLAALVSRFSGEPVSPFKDKLIWKNPGVSGYELHQDYTFWIHLGAPPEAMLTAAVAIDPARRENGAIQLYPGLHHRHHLPDRPPGGIFSSGSGVSPPRVVEGTAPVVPELDPGDVLIFHSLTPHESGPNESERARRLLFISFCAARFGRKRARYYRSFRGFLEAERKRTGFYL